MYFIKVNRVEAQVTSSVELSGLQKNQMQNSLEQYTQKNVASVYSTDESLIGGFIVKINDTVLDASVKQQLNKLRKKLFEQQNVIN